MLGKSSLPPSRSLLPSSAVRCGYEWFHMLTRRVRAGYLFPPAIILEARLPYTRLKAAIQAVGKDMNNKKFAQEVVKWGTGPAQAKALLEELVGLEKNNNITEITRLVTKWKGHGLTPQHAMNIAEAYRYAESVGRGGDAAPIRAELMEFVAYLIKKYGN